ncbi:PAS domain-containing protein [Ligilactobacillus pobuzihii]|uniref:Flavoprotein n=1 Tax=Ligilactobacillus pobuzihii TaxID=449659 RepID=A0A0R2L2X9_9LACO|nr:PAS domain-containing protein [Ligilactobacillus pobuzihii]KRK08968.1 flavoprotein [Ligilactobacillus pobuzihii E100301 = KCTC 13174]KRN95792.1 flavoprotein [Ligilactobacillus pobuzihii]GEN49171.1 hypothetical protein LPO01_19630 [Ligilactobacillus pobuzihii]
MTEENTQNSEPQVEDLFSTNDIDTTVTGIKKDSDTWIDQATEKTKAVSGETYVKLDCGILTVNQLNYFLNSMPFELTFADDNNQFLYYNNMMPADEMLAGRKPSQVGNAIAYCHPPRARKGAAKVVNMLRNGKTDKFRLAVPGNGPDKCVLHDYIAMHDEQGRYRGVNEQIYDLMPAIKWYLKHTGQKLVNDPNATADTVTGPSQHEKTGAKEETDATSSASQQN